MSESLRNAVLWAVLGLILALRLAGLGLYPLMDTSEARYGEMARKMLELDDWITPMFDYGVPFWGKPPLSFWTQAASMHWLGINEFALRLPAWLMHLLSCLLIIHLGHRERSLAVGLLAAIIYSSCTLGLIASGVVLTDPALSLGLLLAYQGFWYGMAHGEGNAVRLGFVGLGLGLLAKGPLVLVLFAVPALTWVAYQQQWRQLWRLPWLSGLSLMLLLAMPWYVLAELKSPGFLDYFLLGEHWKRYVISEWSGDLYGNAHAKPLGTIWLYLLGALFPWSLLLPLLYWSGNTHKGRALQGFLWCWALAAPVFFSLAGNILWTYVLPALPAWALLLANALTRWRWWRPVGVGGFALILPLFALLLVLEGSLEQRPQNQRDLVLTWQRASVEQPGPLIYLGRRSYSAEFYSAGKARRIDALSQLPTGKVFYLARRLRDLDSPLPAPLNCTSLAQANASLLLRCQPLPVPLLSKTVSGNPSS
ncbi:ArnT family glycosyltransferase [Pseudomonas rubra]|uniref:Phospholipid carrier-dependent glycosyltransferase n=1 Tax=Pseudomonas rubra TaxID=2942627 RepID=A0ABT5P1E1_9PSED|nr:phospholipid carrier-dependent glycosyltransferase [Pseudomonas rubra]MDD1012091.1 phospholipid carrier-dependent glycosyltransferase [Pseudomonas rubra]MDD1038473.1 phospholipid carrier-dependent glycosyltransferase [Pseudomonas rubra]MDD1153510.1 phospholipid carrier-dependent glycosyltransferase [Pseudomonas rubra]